MPAFPRTLAIEKLSNAAPLALELSLDENWQAAKDRFDHVGMGQMIVYEMSRRSSEEMSRRVLLYTRISLILSTCALVVAIISLVRTPTVIVIPTSTTH